MTATIDLAVQLEVLLRFDGQYWVSWCVPLDLLTQGDSRQEALAAIHEAVEAWFESCIERGVLTEALSEVGFRTRSEGSNKGPDLQNHPHAEHWQSSDVHSEIISVSIPAYALESNLGL